MAENFDVVIIGSGPGGYVAAIRAAQLGMKTAIIEKADLGGICLNWGCIPTKALLRCSEIHHLLQNADQFGFTISGIKFDLQKIVERSRKVAAQLSSGISHLMKKNKITVIKGHGKLAGKGKVVIEQDKNNTEVLAKHIIISTGARARILPGFEPDGKFIYTYREAMTPKELPKKLLVVGSGAIGIEFASFYHNLGSEVTVIEVMDKILPVEDDEISTLARKSFESQGIKIHTGAKIQSATKNKDNVTATVDIKGKIEKFEVNAIIMAVGIEANTENLGLEHTAVKIEKGHIVTNEWLETNEKNVYAIGDVAGAPWLAHKASHEGVVCVEKISGSKDAHPICKTKIPGCTYSMPQIASVGLTEKQAIEKGYKIKVGRFPFIGNGKAVAMGESEGLVKTIFDEKTGELLGAHMIGAEVTEMIQGFVIAKNLEATELDLMHSIFPHPTLSEMMHESVLSAFGKVIHF
jgi:dihydrolipoamide dehydrogenase